MIINALYKVRSVNFSKLSSGFDNKAESSSNYRRIQRFFAEVNRIRNNFKIYCPKRQKEITAWHLFTTLANGELRHYNKIIKMHGEYIAIFQA